MIFIIPLIFKDGIWLAAIAAEILGVIVSVYFLRKIKLNMAIKKNLKEKDIKLIYKIIECFNILF